MEKVCPRCKLPQKGIYECEYCGLSFAQYKKPNIKEKFKWENTPKNNSKKRNQVVIVLAIVGFIGLVYFQYQRESAKTTAELADKNKQRVIKQKKEQQTPEKKKSVSKRNRLAKKDPSGSKKVTCNKFNLHTDITGRNLKFWLTTDLPNDTTVMTSVSRRYWEKGSSETYLGSYSQTKSSVHKLLKPVTVIIDDDKWKKQIEKKQHMLASIGEPFEISRISDNVEIDLTVPVNQKNPIFGKMNKNLKGTKVIDDHGLRIIRDNKSFLIPFGKMLSAEIRTKKQYNLNAYNLEPNVLYRISKKTPIFKELEPVDKIKAIAEMGSLPAGSVIRILRTIEKGSFPYYYVRADVKGNKRIKVEGWIHGGALLGQDLSVIE